MRGALRLGKVFGIDIAIDWSFVLVFVLMTSNLTDVFHRWHPTWKLGPSLFLAVVAALLFFGSVLAHELGHCLVARRFGVKVRDVRLWLLGGVATFEREPPTARAEFWIAIAGPLVSIALGLGFAAGAAFMVTAAIDPMSPWDTLARLGPLGTLFFWLGPINVVVGIFNLIPGFPLDGGRILRAILWRMTGDLHKATLASSFIGRGIGATFILIGIAIVFGAKIPLFGQGAGSGLWLVFIGWFLSSAAASSYKALLVQEVLDGVRVGMLMRRSGWAVPADTMVTAVVNEWFMRSGERAFPVVADDKLVGLVCIADVRKLPQTSWDSTGVTAIMTPREQLTVAAPGEDATAALRKLGERDVDQLPVLEGERLVGMLTRGEIARWLELHLSGQSGMGSPRPA